MRDESGRGMKPNTSNLNADLSRIEIIFSDKTGTLTENKMLFKKCCIRTGRIHDESAQPGELLRILLPPSVEESSLYLNNEFDNSECAEHDPLTKSSRRTANGDNGIEEERSGSNDNESRYSADDRYWMHEYMRCLTLCNTVMPHVDPTTDQIKLDGESPDEIALLNSAAQNGYRMLDRDDDGIELEILGERKFFKILAALPFDSDRKRMSMIVQESKVLESNRTELAESHYSPRTLRHKIYCYCKGADSSLLPLVNDQDLDSGVDKMLSSTIDTFAREGLRTLLLCRKEIDPEFCADWIKRFNAAQMEIDRDLQSQLLFEEIEHSFELIGVTAIEDKLQEKVPETVSFFREAGVQMWMLTGDKRETAVNIARSANLLNEDNSEVHTINADTLKECSKQLAKVLWSVLSPHLNLDHDAYDLSTTTTSTSTAMLHNNREGRVNADEQESDTKREHALVIDGNSLAYIFGNHPRLHKNRRGRELVHKAMAVGVEAGHRVRRRSAHVVSTIRSRANRSVDAERPLDAAERAIQEEERRKNLIILQRQCFEAFVKIVQHCSMVICCRATPLQKALLVRLMKRKFNKIGLAIGDGANDVSMIQEARVGIGIMGLEGSQASRAADYSIHRFHHLRRLLAVHGRYSMVRTGLFIQYSFYKNIVITLLQTLFTMFNLFSGQTFLDSWFITFYNLAFTMLTPFVMGLLERDVSEKVLMENPIIYKQCKVSMRVVLFFFLLLLLVLTNNHCFIYVCISLNRRKTS